MNPLLRLLIDNRGRGRFNVANNAAGDEATIYLYDVIVSDDYWGGVSALAFAKEIAAIQAGTIHLRINCPGGDVFAGQAMAQAIRETDAHVIAHVDGVAASAGSWVALAADEVVISQGGMFMIHKGITGCYGNADDMRKTTALLDKVDAILVATYAKETGQDHDKIAAWLADETWFNAEEAVAQGFADRIADGGEKPSNVWNLSAYAKAPKLPPPNEPEPEPAPTVEDVADTEHLRRRLSLVEKQAA